MSKLCLWLLDHFKSAVMTVQKKKKKKPSQIFEAFFLSCKNKYEIHNGRLKKDLH